MEQEVAPRFVVLEAGKEPIHDLWRTAAVCEENKDGQLDERPHHGRFGTFGWSEPFRGGCGAVMYNLRHY